MDWTFWSPTDDADEQAAARRTLADAVSDTTERAHRLVRWVATAPEAELHLERREEGEIVAAIGRAEEAVATMAHAATHLDDRERLLDVYEELDGAARAAEAYEQARHRRDRAAMHDAAEAVTRAAATAAAFADVRAHPTP